MDNEMFKFAVELAKKAGKYAHDKNSALIVNYKDSDLRNLVTNVDLEIDEMLQREILDKYPNHAIHSEESKGVSNGDEYKWALDPIDGTSNYARSIPHYATSISVLKNDDVYVGAVYNPVTDECFTVSPAGDAELNGNLINVGGITEIKDAYVNFHPGRKEEHRVWAGELKVKLLGSAKKSLNLGASALDICYIASGRMDIMIYGTLSTLDIAGAIKILRVAGGELYDYKTREPVEISGKPQQVIATNNTELLEDFFRQTGSKRL